jgi:hypothetical protein
MAGPVYIEREMIKSKAFRSLSATAILVVLDFFAKRQFCRRPNSNGKKEFVISNNGDIQYSYKEAESRGITRPAFQRAIDALMARGFIDIAHHGAGGKKGDVNLYEVSNKWRSWKEGDIVFLRQKDTRQGVGFALVHRRRKENIGNADVTPTSNADVTSEAINE